MIKHKKKPKCQSPYGLPYVKPQKPGSRRKHIKISTNVVQTVKLIRKCAVDTEDRLYILFSKYDDIVQIENANIYWSEKYGVIAVCTTQEWKDYFLGKINIPESEISNNE